MSKVYSFRLSEDNPREAQAREGYSLRHIITEVLLITFENNKGDEEVINLLAQIKKMIFELESIGILDYNDEPKTTDLPASFIVAVKNATKNGLRLE